MTLVWDIKPAVRTQSALAVRDLVKRYQSAGPAAVDGISFDVSPGEILVLLGPNGAGKSTTLDIATTRLPATSGSVHVAGIDVAADPTGARAVFATVSQRPNLDRSVTVRQNLTMHGAYHGMPRRDRHARADELLDRFGLADRAGARTDTLSGGLGQRVMIARGLMHRPAVVFLDEPSTGLDVQSRLFLYDLLAGMAAEGAAVVVTTHDMAEAEQLAQRVAVIDHGRLLALDTPARLVRDVPGSSALSVTLAGAADAAAIAVALERLPGVRAVESTGDLEFRLHTDVPATDLLAALRDVVVLNGLTLQALTTETPSLQDVFLRLTGRELR